MEHRPARNTTEIRERASGTRRFDLNNTRRVTAHGRSETYAYDETGNVTRATDPDHPADGEREFTGTP
ncbi:hypothetical protein [Streptomyces sp. H27-D2]|uniref:hypothetical protein n=1 Tax=Streptomyces sp. H27-D2 TaxID=3046304 RepID=UPI002DBDFC7D|nr:hypothetical protein [Streptomyces sp. H27-D2]MEC4016978.1 hypothetical protein [Streptomyces sp. H27-D2]